MRFLLAILALLSLPATAQEMSSDYNVIGYVDLIMDGEETRLPVVTVPAREQTFARLNHMNEEHGIDQISIAGVTPAEDGNWQFPMIEFSVNTNNNELFHTIFIRYSVESFRNDYAFTAEIEDQTAQIGNLVTDENGLVDYDFRGQLTHRDRDPETGKTTPQEGRDTVEISGHVHVVIPVEFQN